MKASRSEQVLNTVGKYMKRRQYSDGDAFKKSDLQLSHNLKDMSFNGTVHAAGSSTNVINFSSISGDATAIDQQFSRLKLFISEASEPFKSELTHLLFPMFIQLYLELISNGQKAAAQKFHSRHTSLFLETENYKTVVDALSSVLTVEDIEQQQQIKTFRENKYTVRLSEDCYEYVSRFLKNMDHITLLQLLNLCIDVEIINESQPLPVPFEDAFGPNGVTSSPNKKSDSDPNKPEKENQAALNSLKEIIRKVRSGPPSLPSICLYSVSNATHGLSCLNINDDNSLIGCGFEDSSIHLWSTTSGGLQSEPTGVNVANIKLACDTVTETGDFKTETKILRGHSGPVYGLDFFPNTDVMLSCSDDTTVRAWSLKTHTNVALYNGHSYPVFDVDISPLGVYFATASHDCTARIWSLDRTYPLRILAGHNLDVDCVKFHPNCNYIATGSSDKSLRLWSVQEGRLVRLFQGHRGSIFAIAFSPNGQLMASAGEDRRIKIWDLASGSSIRELRGHTDTVYSLSFNGDGSVLASSGLEHSIRLWDVRKGNHSATTTTPSEGADGHTSPELLAVYPVKQTSIPFVKYTKHSMLMAVGIVPNVVLPDKLKTENT